MTFVRWVSSGRCSRQLIFPCSVSSCSCSTKTNQVQNKAAKVGQAYAPLISRPPQKYKISQLGHQEMPGRVKISPCMGLFYMLGIFSVDWLLTDLVRTKMCPPHIDQQLCFKDAWILHHPSLFQHVGTHSSLRGKLQELKDPFFNIS